MRHFIWIPQRAGARRAADAGRAPADARRSIEVGVIRLRS
ncbi:MAG: hypothetical protein OJF60_001086 [Burkholderiaceae bacterium]|nr:MAG: hypothetical protein OJF60_001086 [Burkholderiaceae bacterium]